MLRYLSEIRFQVLAAIYPRFTHESGTIREKQAIEVSKLKRLLCYESQHQNQSNEKSLVQFDSEKAVSNYLGTQSTFNPSYADTGCDLKPSSKHLFIRYVAVFVEDKRRTLPVTPRGL